VQFAVPEELDHTNICGATFRSRVLE
jgi:hypothetical protein